MNRAGSGLSDREDPSEAILRAVDDAMNAGELTAPNAGFLFATHPHAEKLGELAQTITEICGAESVVGATGTGVLSSSGEVEGRGAVAVLLVESDEIRFEAFGSENLRGRDEAVAAELTDALEWSPASEGSPEDERLLVLFPDTQSFNPMSFFPALAEGMGGIRTVGGGATSLLGEASTVHGARHIFHGLSGALLRGDFSANIATLSSMRLVTKPMIVTRCRANLVSELDGLPALVVFQNVASRLFGLDPLRAAGALFIALRFASSGGTETPFVVRNLVGLDPARQILALSQPVEVGDELAFCVLEAGEARRLLNQSLEALRGQKPSFALYFNCAGRGQNLYGESNVDTRQIREILGPIPMAGFFSGAEIAPVGPRNQLHLFTGVLTLIGPRA